MDGFVPKSTIIPIEKQDICNIQGVTNPHQVTQNLVDYTLSIDAKLCKIEECNSFDIGSYHDLRMYDCFKSIVGVKKAQGMSYIKDTDGNRLFCEEMSPRKLLNGIVKQYVCSVGTSNIDERSIQLTTRSKERLRSIYDLYTSSPKEARALLDSFFGSTFSHCVNGTFEVGGMFEYVIICEDVTKASNFVQISNIILQQVKRKNNLYGSQKGVWYEATELSCEHIESQLETEDLSSYRIRISKYGGSHKPETFTKWKDSVGKATENIPITSTLVSAIPLWQMTVITNEEFCKFIEMFWRQEIRNTAFDELLNLLNLKGFYLGSKISTENVMSLYDANPNEKPTLSDLPWVMIKKIMVLDNSVRECDHCQADEFSNSKDEELEMHPSDVLLLIFKCCDPFLQQVLVNKMFQCLLSLPLLIQVLECRSFTWSLWPLESRVIDWRNEDNNACENLLVRHPMHIVSFVRLGELHISKSHLLNNVISTGSVYHDMFCTNESSNGWYQKVVSNGLVELACYLPSCSRFDAFSEELILLNLRGNAIEHKLQYIILKEMSSVMLLVIDIAYVLEQKEKLHQLVDSKIIFFISCKHQSVPDSSQIKCIEDLFLKLLGDKMYKTNICMAFTNKRSKSTVELQKEIRKKISLILQSSANSKCSLVDHATNFSSRESVELDEQHMGSCLEEKKFSKELINATATSLFDFKVRMLPLQGEDWHQWGKLKKDLVKPKTDVIYANDELQAQMNLCRHNQLKLCPPNMTLLMQRFLEHAKQKLGKKEDLSFFLAWIKIELDHLSRQTLPELHKKYQDMWIQYTSMKDRLNREENVTPGLKLQNLETEMEKMEQKIADSTFGLEHILRETGQMYEALLHANRIEGLQFLPNLAAEILMLGYPIEIMDGDAATVPLQWVTAVFESIWAIIGNKKLFVVSVIGIQSSGKSTLLNTMFGLEFAVSAGRCTRGVFAQLLPLTYANRTFDYLLILDSEGLRAPELSSKRFQHDNILSTFVIGIADLTIINIKGENTSEVHNVLQITVHSLLRISLTIGNKHRRCLFVYQNISASNAKEKMVSGQRKLKRDLDHMAVEAAKVEGKNISSFNNVIAFDLEQDIWYLPGLWNGNPPMAHVNHEYSERVQCLKKTLLKTSMTEGHPGTTIHNLLTHIQDFWHAVLTDDFVFNFKNSLAIKAYLSLESKFSFLKYQSESKIDQWVITEAHSQISKSNNLKDLEQNYLTVLEGLKSTVYVQRESNSNELIQYFDKDTGFKDIICEWRRTKLQLLEDHTSTYCMKTELQLNLYREQHRVVLDQLGKKHKDAEFIMKTALERAQTLRGMSPTPEMIDSEFEEMWQKIEIPAHDDTMNERVIQEHMHTTLMNHFHSLGRSKDISKFVKNVYKAKEKPLLCLKESIRQHTIQESDYTSTISTSQPPSYFKPKVAKVLNQVLASVDATLDDICSSHAKFLSSHGTKFVNAISHACSDIDKLDAEFRITGSCEAKIAVYAVQYAIPKFEDMNVKFENLYGKTAKLREYKETMKTYFNNKVTHGSKNVATAELFVDTVKKMFHQKLNEYMCLYLLDEAMRILKNKQNLMKEIMHNILTSKNFHAAIQFIANGRTFAKTWLRNHISDILFRDQSGAKKQHYEREVVNQTEDIIGKIIEALHMATRSAKSHKENDNKSATELWSLTFCENQNLISKVDLYMFERQQIDDYDDLQNQILSRIISFKHRMTADNRELKMDSLLWKASTNIVEKVWGCTEYCPFCKEPCFLSKSHDGDHKCMYHRPNAIVGTKAKGTKEMSLTTCSQNVAGNDFFKCVSASCSCRGEQGNTQDVEEVWHMFSHYKEYYTDWDIKPNCNDEGSKFWRWFTCFFETDIAEYYDINRPKSLPITWQALSDADASESLYSDSYF